MPPKHEEVEGRSAHRTRLHGKMLDRTRPLWRGRTGISGTVTAETGETPSAGIAPPAPMMAGRKDRRKNK